MLLQYMADRLSALRIRAAGDCAGVDNRDIGRFPILGEPVPMLQKILNHHGRLGLIELASEGLENHRMRLWKIHRCSLNQRDRVFRIIIKFQMTIDKSQLNSNIQYFKLICCVLFGYLFLGDWILFVIWILLFVFSLGYLSAQIFANKKELNHPAQLLES